MNWMDILVKTLIGLGFIVGIGDAVLNNKFGLAERFRQGFSMIGPMMLSMAGIMSIAPVIAELLRPIVEPCAHLFRIDPSVLSILLGCDMGGYQLAMSLAENREIGLMMGLATASMLGGTLTFSIPVGAALLKDNIRGYYFQGLLIGVTCIPIGSMINGVLLKIPVTSVIWNNIPVILLTVAIAAGMKCHADKMIWIMDKLARGTEIIGFVGIGFGGVQYLTDWSPASSFMPLMESMKIVCQMGITLIGMLPTIEIFLRLAKRYLDAAGRRFGLDGASTTGLMTSLVTTIPVYPLMQQMTKKGVVVNAAWTVFCSGIFGSQLGLIMGIDSDLLPPFYAAKFSAAFAAMIVTMIFFKWEEKKEKEYERAWNCENP